MQNTLTPADLRSLLASGQCQLVDVREPVEYQEEHLPEAKLLPLGELELKQHELNKSTPIVVMCRSGKRGQTAQTKLQQLGFSHVSNLEGGIMGWKKAGFPVKASSRKMLPLMQQVQLVIGLGALTGVVLSLTVHPLLVLISGFFGAGLVFAGSTGWCGLAILLSKMPWNRVPGAGATSSCTVA
ncbi:MAG: hypothetical protein RL693_2749 [Verrucomicrobiota bacterium]|jgi:rhodanese-related sulfurtransferase